MPGKQLVARLQHLAVTIESIISDGHGHLLDNQLAEYAFFPLSHVFRQRQAIPIPALELALRSLQALLNTGWAKDIAPELGIQLMILLTFIACDSDGSLKVSTTSDELLGVDFSCLAANIRSLTSSQAGRNALTATSNIPALGHAITGVLDAVNKADAQSVGEQALRSLDAFVVGLDRDALSSFLPGMVSTLTKILTPSSAIRRPYALLTRALDLVAVLLKRTVSNAFGFNAEKSRVEITTAIPPPQLSRGWLTATAGQIKQALANITKLRRHQRIEVRTALHRLCMTVLQECNQNLEESTSLMLDTLVAIAQGDQHSGAASSLRILFLENDTYVEQVRNNLYSQLLSMPRFMMSNDLSVKESQVQHIVLVITLLENTGSEFGLAQEGILTAVRESINGTIQQQYPAKIATSQLEWTSTKLQSSIGKPEQDMITFPSVFTTSTVDNAITKEICTIVSSISATKDATRLVRSCLDQLQMNMDSGVLTNLWLALHILRFRASTSTEFDDLLNLDITSSDEYQQRDELYSFALSILSNFEDPVLQADMDWRLSALALEVISFHSSNLRQAFRPELADALYPVLHHLGSSVPQLQHHAMVTLNSVAASTGYLSPQAMIIDNNDYLINGISLRLSTFDLSPQAPRVLYMLVRLCGSKLLPFLDDVTDSIFDGLELYHGYENLVGLLFQCLGSVVEEGVKAPALATEAGTVTSNRLKSDDPTSMTGLTLMFRQRRVSSDINQDPEHLHFQENLDAPENSAQLPPDDEQPKHDVLRTEDPSSLSSPEPENLPYSKVYQLIHRIVVLAQHHLPSGNALIRSHLSHVLSTAMPYLAEHEDSFLPLIHTLWPVLVPRLQDSESSVVTGVLEVMAKMIEGSGDFVRGRIADIWDNIRGIHHRSTNYFTRSQQVSLGTKAGFQAPRRLLTQNEPQRTIDVTKQPNTSSQGSLPMSVVSSLTSPSPIQRGKTYVDGAYIPTSSLTMHRALTAFLTSLISHVDIAAWMFDDVVSDMLLPYLVTPSGQATWIEETTKRSVTDALQERNADAVWLINLRHGLIDREADKLGQRWPTSVNGAVTFAKLTKVH